MVALITKTIKYECHIYEESDDAAEELVKMVDECQPHIIKIPKDIEKFANDYNIFIIYKLPGEGNPTIKEFLSKPDEFRRFEWHDTIHEMGLRNRLKNGVGES